MWLSKASHILQRVISPVAVALNGIGVGAMLLIVGLIAASILLRYLFAVTLLCAYLYEITEVMLLVLVFFGLMYTTMKKGHVAVDILVSRFPSRAQAATDSITYFLSLVLVAVISWRNFVEAGETALTGEASVMLSMPVFIFQYVIAVTCALACVVLLVNLLDSIARVAKK